jgi:DNA-directed RNA polymerase subunit RPC12/RpoP
MSLRRLYGSIQTDKRRCSYYRCQKPILRNIDRDKDGHIYHHGCLMSAQDERYRCLECFAIFDATEASFDIKPIIKDDDATERLQIICPHCGSINLKPSQVRGG